MKRDIVDRIIHELSIHAAIEEQVFYPAVGREPQPSSQVLESLEEHHIVKWLLSELERMLPNNDRFDVKGYGAEEVVQHHVEEEGERPLPQGASGAVEVLPRAARRGARPSEVRAGSPPSSLLPDKALGNLITSAAAGVVDGGEEHSWSAGREGEPRDLGLTRRSRGARADGPWRRQARASGCRNDNGWCSLIAKVNQEVRRARPEQTRGAADHVWKGHQEGDP